MTQKSKEAHEAILPKVGSIKRRILDVIKSIDSTTGQIEFKTGIHYSTLTARLSELHDEGLIMPTTDGVIDRYTMWTVVPDERREYVVRMRKNEKFRKWLRRGLNDFSHLLPDFVRYWMQSRLN